MQARPIISFFRPEHNSSTPATPPATAPDAAAADQSTAAAAGTATGTNLAATALAQQPVLTRSQPHFVKALLSPPRHTTPFKCAAAVRFVTGSVITPLLSHPSLPHPLCPPVGVRKCYPTPWFITPPSWPLRAALYHPGYVRYHTPHRIPHPVIHF